MREAAEAGDRGAHGGGCGASGECGEARGGDVGGVVAEPAGQRDRHQAEVVFEAIKIYLPQYEIRPEHLKYLPKKAMVQSSRSILVAESLSDVRDAQQDSVHN